jgi:hypothetical protein
MLDDPVTEQEMDALFPTGGDNWTHNDICALIEAHDVMKDEANAANMWVVISNDMFPGRFTNNQCRLKHRALIRKVHQMRQRTVMGALSPASGLDRIRNKYFSEN